MKIEKTIVVPMTVGKLKYIEEDEPMIIWVDMGDYYEQVLLNPLEFGVMTYHKIDVEYFDDRKTRR